MKPSHLPGDLAMRRDRGRPAGFHTWAWFATAAIVLVSASQLIRSSRAASTTEWGAPEMMAHLLKRAPGLRAVTPSPDGRARHVFYLTTTAKGRDELIMLPRMMHRIADWKGTVHCEYIPEREHMDLLTGTWGEHCLDLGDFVFFGDRELLAQIRAALPH